MEIGESSSGRTKPSRCFLRNLRTSSRVDQRLRAASVGLRSPHRSAPVVQCSPSKNVGAAHGAGQDNKDSRRNTCASLQYSSRYCSTPPGIRVGARRGWKGRDTELACACLVFITLPAYYGCTWQGTTGNGCAG